MTHIPEFLLTGTGLNTNLQLLEVIPGSLCPEDLI